MQKVVGSSPIIRSDGKPRWRGVFVFGGENTREAWSASWSAFGLRAEPRSRRTSEHVVVYLRLVAGMEKAAELGVDELEVVSDSELLVKQMQGDYRVKNAALKALWEEANDLERRFRRVRYTAVRRAHNELADSLVNEALDAES